MWPMVGVAREVKVRSACMTTAAHMFGTYPFVYFPCFFLVNETVGRGRSLEDAKEKIATQCWPIYKTSFFVWTPLMFVQFFWVPLPLQILWINSGSFIWTACMSLWFCGDQKGGQAPPVLTKSAPPPSGASEAMHPKTAPTSVATQTSAAAAESRAAAAERTS